MRKRDLIFSSILASISIICVSACNGQSEDPAKVSVDKDFEVAIYSTTDKGGVLDTISPCLLEETVHISELLRYSNGEGVTMPFNFSDTTKYAQITAINLNKRIAISVNGQVVYTPVVTMKLHNGACSVVLDDAQIAELFPNVDINELTTSKN